MLYLEAIAGFVQYKNVKSSDPHNSTQVRYYYSHLMGADGTWYLSIWLKVIGFAISIAHFFFSS